MKLPVLMSVALVCVACSPTPAAKPIAHAAPGVEQAPPMQVPVIAVLEDRPGATTGEQARFVVRMVFQKDGAGWRTLDPECSDEACLSSAPARLPPTAAWTVVYGGKTKGHVNGKTPKAWKQYADVGMQELASGSLVATVGDRSRDFSADQTTPLYRPLIALSMPTVSDPDAWTAAGALSPEALAALATAFRSEFAEVPNCKTEGGADLQPITYADADIVTSGFHTSTKGWTIVTAHLKGYRCDGPLEETAFAPHAFAISPDGKAQNLGEGLRFVDAGDFDGDGKSELVFAIQQGNTGGYKLFFNDFAGQAVFDFSYH